jgi:hypothetical protein
LYVDGPGPQIHVPPLECEQLAEPHPRAQRTEEESVVLGAACLDRREERVGLLAGERLNFAAWPVALPRVATDP